MEANHNKTNGDIKFAAIVPLIGGFAIGNSMATGNKPTALFTYDGFQSNESHLRAYWPDVPYINLDHENPTVDRLDFVSTTCPCAGLSMLNYSKNGGGKSRGSDAAQNEWMYRSAKYVLGELKPRVFFGENAPGLFGEIGKGVVEKLFEIAQEYGYSMSLMKTSTSKHGIPQERSRTFYFFWDSEYAPVLNYYDRERKDLVKYLAEVPSDASLQETFNTWNIEDLPTIRFLEEKKGLKWSEIMADEDKGTLNWYIVKNGWLDECIEYADEIMPGSVDSRVLHHMKVKLADGKGFWDGSPRLGRDHFNAVISKNMICGAHPEEKRFITLREYMHLMGLPHDFELLEKGQWNHIAQNVPTATARDWTLEVIKYIKGELPSSGQKLFRQNNLNGQHKIEEAIKTTCLF
jgi:site-specific DNA-cytosine methylase